MKSPLKDRPLRNPGQSLDEELNKFLDDAVSGPLLVAALLVVLACLDWFRWYQARPPNPIVFTVAALGGIAYAAIRIYRARKHVRQIKLGRDGERAVGPFLETLREGGAKVFHDFPGKGFNIDHVVVHVSGVYAVETKTFSKPDRGEALIVFKGDCVEVMGKKPDRNPVVQARANAKWLSDLIKESTGRVVPVRPVVVFPGWYVQPTAEAKASDVWVLNPRMLPGFIGRSAPQLPDPDARMVAFHLSRYARTTE
jgi:hypothetical protein